MKLNRIILTGALIRLALMPFIAHPFDVYAWHSYCSSFLNGGLGLNAVLSFSPLWLLTLMPIAYVYGFLSVVTGAKAIPVSDLPSQMNPQWGISYIPGPLFNVVVKIPMVLSDTVLAFLLYRLVLERFGVDAGEKTAAFFYLNPAVIWISSAWGQYDSLAALFTVLSVYLLVKERFIFSSLSLLVATLYKVYPVAFLMPVSIYLFRRESIRKSARFLSVFLVPFSFFLIFDLDRVFRFAHVFFGPETFQGIFGFGLTYWSISLLYPLNSEVFNPVSIGLMIFLISISLYYMYRAEYSDQLEALTLWAILTAASLFLSYRYPTEQRMIWLMPFLAIAMSQGLISGKLFWGLSVTGFLYMQKTFPQYLLPLATLNVDALLPLFQSTEKFRIVAQGALMPTLTSAAVLAALGIGFSILMLKLYLGSLGVIRLR